LGIGMNIAVTELEYRKAEGEFAREAAEEFGWNVSISPNPMTGGNS
jgi:hypothetical protein